MKAIKTTMKLGWFVVLVLLGASAAHAQDARINTSQLDSLTPRASQTVDVNVDEKLIGLTLKFLSSNDPDEKKIREAVSGLKGIYVRSFTFETEGQYSVADLESVRSQLRTPNWNKIVNIVNKKEGNLEVYLSQTGTQVNGLALVAFEPKELTIVNIVGPVDLEKLSEIEGNFGVPELGIDKHQKSKPKN
jgi:hypothetical protein